MPKAKSPSPAASRAPASPPSLGLPRCHQSIWARVVRIHARICAGEHFNKTDLEREFETDKDGVQRALRTMRDDLGAPLDFDRSRNTFYYTREWPHLPHIVLTPDEQQVLKLIRRHVPAEQDSAMGHALQTLLGKVEWIAGHPRSETDTATDDLTLSAALLGAVEQKHLPQIQQAIEERRELELDYSKSGALAPEPHRVRPHMLRFIRHQWILLTHDLTRAGDLRTFLLRRIVRATPTAVSFTRPKGFDPHAILDGNFCAFTGTEDHRVRLGLHGPAAVDATEQPWHRSQQTRVRPDRSVEIDLRLNNLVDIKHEVLRWGEHAEVLAPPPLREAVRQSLAAASARYARAG